MDKTPRGIILPNNSKLISHELQIDITRNIPIQSQID